MNSMLRRLALATLPPVQRLFIALRQSEEARAALMLDIQALASERDALRKERRCSQVDQRSPLWHWASVFDAMDILPRHRPLALTPVPGFIVNFLGVQVDPAVFPDYLAPLAGTVEELPIPANWHADIAEWAAALRAVDLAKDSFTVIELGCGWGCWLNNTGLAARRAGKRPHLIGVEGDEAHIALAQQAAARNGFSAAEISLRRGIAAAEAGVALFPRRPDGVAHWGLRPIFGATAAQRAEARVSGSHDELPMLSLEDIAEPHGRIDLLHVDIQGSEADLIATCLPTLRQKVAYLVVGTHSRQIEGRIVQVLHDAGWRLEIERPAVYTGTADALTLTIDGVQGWRNPALSPI